jgi:cell division protein YceG involved in septum cleavage
VIYNRLKNDIRLDIDATTRFAVGNWKRPLRQSELDNPSPYNTRVHAGLPPGPIGNPGLASIKAAARPAKTSFLFYVVKPGTCGEHNFSATDAEFQRDVDAYNRAREKRGGRSPTTC